MTAPEPLISAEALKELHGREDVVILDASWTYDGGPAPRVEGAIPGAVRFNIDEVSDQASSLPHMLPSPAAFEQHARAIGIGDSSQIIVYDRIGLFSAPRVWWMFLAMGARNVRVLDGGLPAWIDADGALTDRPAAMTGNAPGDFVARFDATRAASADDVAHARSGACAQLLDVRSAARFSGAEPEPRPGLRAGHILGALNAPWTELLTTSQHLKPATELRERLSIAGVAFDQPVILTCGSGVTACIGALALEALGHGDWSVYDGSWAEWGGDPARPIETVAAGVS
ncbi:MAG: sulfurtransferase [Maricaulaceae bacterium]|jgi:thiosulfate/3-mercaptopyruvate sulfurtransferase